MNDEMKIIADAWNEISLDFDEMHATEDIDMWKAELIKLIGENKKGKVLDIGTGTGFMAIMLAELGHTVSGVDIADDMLELGRKKMTEKGLNIDFMHCDGENLKYEGNTFDVIVNCRVLWTLLEPQKAFIEWKRVLKTGGIVLSFMRLAENTTENKNWCYGEEFEKNLKLKFATEEEYIHEFKKAGFNNVKIVHMPEEISAAPLNPWFCVYCEK